MKAAISETEDIPLFVSKKLAQFVLSVVPNAQGLPHSAFLGHNGMWGEEIEQISNLPVIIIRFHYQICHLDEVSSV